MLRVQHFVLTIVAAMLAFAIAQAGCTAGGASGFDDDDDSGQGANGGNLFFGGMGGGTTTACSDPGCIGLNPQGNCDTGLAIDSADAMDGARAVGICQVADQPPGSWGVVNAEWVRSDGQPLGGALTRGKGILDHFGPMTAREGAKMLAISSGSARNPGEPDYNPPSGDQKDMTPHGAPPGYPKESPECPGVTTGPPHDSAGLRLQIRTPLDAKSFTFDFDFYTFEYPDYICSEFNDYFVAMLSPIPAGLTDGNISFDGQGNTISVNAGFLEACTPCTIGSKSFGCGLGYGEIQGTGFETNLAMINCPFIPGSAATSWLVTTAPVEIPGGEIALHFAVWDSGDAVLDSTVLIDNFRFELGEGQVGTTPVPR